MNATDVMPQSFYVTGELVQFASALESADAFAGEISNVLYFLEKPWKWSSEYLAWLHAGRPGDDSEEGWDAFQTAVDAK